MHLESFCFQNVDKILSWPTNAWLCWFHKQYLAVMWGKLDISGGGGYARIEISEIWDMETTLERLCINCTILMKTNSRFSRNVYTISDKIWCNKHLRRTTAEKYENNEKGGYFRFDDDNKMSYRYILSINLHKWASWTHTTPFIVIKIKGNR